MGSRSVYQHWSPQQDKQLLSLHNQGLRNAEIAFAMCRSLRSIKGRKNVLGIGRNRDINRVLKERQGR